MNKKILIIDLILVVSTLAIIAGVVGYARPLVIAPIDDYNTTSTTILFSFERANLIIVDDNLEFTSPQEYYVEDNLVIDLSPGKYYWKVVGLRESEIRELTIESEISLKIKQEGENYSVVNSGNVPLNVEVYENGQLTGSLHLKAEEKDLAKGDSFLGREDA